MGTEVSSKKIVAAFAADAAFAMPLAVSLYSTALHLKNSSLAAFVISVGIPEEDRRRLHRVAESVGADVTWIDGSEVYHNLFSTSGLRAKYVRASLPSLLPPELERVVYLDADTLVREDIAPLYDCDLNGHVVLAVRDYRIPFVSTPIGVQHYVELGISPDAPYFNSGVLVLNLPAWRRENLEQQVIDYYRRFGHSMRLNDQEALNGVLRGRWGELEPRWNQQKSVYRSDGWPESDVKEEYLSRLEELRQRPAIVHFTGLAKPWGFRGGHPMQTAWFEAVKESGWFTAGEYVKWYARLKTGRQFLRTAHTVKQAVRRRLGPSWE